MTTVRALFTMVDMKEIVKYANCFVCGDQNNHGLQAKFFLDGDKAVAHVTASQRFEGYRGIYHGGVLSSLLDEVMIKAILAEQRYAVTVELTIRFIAPVRVGDKLTLSGKITKTKGKITFTEGQATGSDGRVFATASGKYIEAGPGLKEQLLKSVG